MNIFACQSTQKPKAKNIVLLFAMKLNLETYTPKQKEKKSLYYFFLN